MAFNALETASQITRIRVYTVVQKPPEFSWSPIMPKVLNTDTIVRLTDDSGQDGISSVCTFTEHGVDNSVLESMRPLLIGLLEQKPQSLKDQWAWMQQRRPGVSNTAIAGLDIAMWDLVAKRQALPLYKLLGGERHSIRAYASIPVMEQASQYIELINTLRQTGFSIFKFHYKSIAEADISLMRDVYHVFKDQGCQFMFDAEGHYEAQGAAKVAAVMEEQGFIWLEAPFDDHDWASYRALKRSTSVPIIPAGNSVVDLAHVQQAIAADCWSALRIDAATAGGISPAMAIFAMAAKSELNVELQSWGSSLSTAANLHLALANANSHYFEVPVPIDDFLIQGVDHFQLDSNGHVSAPKKAGLGLDVDWSIIEATSSRCVEL